MYYVYSMTCMIQVCMPIHTCIKSLLPLCSPRYMCVEAMKQKQRCIAVFFRQFFFVDPLSLFQPILLLSKCVAVIFFAVVHAHAPRPRARTRLHDFHLVEFSHQPLPVH